MDKAQEFNATHPVGTPVRYWPQPRTGEGVQSRTRTPARLLGHGEPVVSVEGYTGGIYLTRVEVLGEGS
ncbi:hypothetical protein [Cellulosimicrobium sp. TH-20]|uniref:hypothetical protein n=1 Tax=Cellulosimicrobium sp. TH-20 TaxID=1980001 RepID=UPI00158437AB